MSGKDIYSELVTEALLQTSGELISVTLESKTDGSILHIIGYNKYHHKIPHIECREGVVYPLSKFFIYEFS